MIPLLVVTILHLIYFLVSRLFFKNITPLSFLVQFQITAQFLIVQLDVGPFSMRVYLALIVALITLPMAEIVIKKIRFARGMQAHVIISAVFLGWLLFSSVFNGNLENPGVYLAEMFSKYIIPIISFFGALALLRNKDDLYSYTTWIFLVASANVLFAMLQSQGLSLAWDVQRALYPYAYNQLLDREAIEGAAVVASYPPGLSQYSIGTGYVITCFGFIGVGFLLSFWNRSRFVAALMVLVVLVLCGYTSLIILSRSSLYIGLLLLVITALLPHPKASPNSALNLGIIAIVVFSGFGLLASKGMEVAVSDYRSLSVDRVFDLSFGERANLIFDSMEFIRENLLFGGRNEAFDSGAIHMVPHNFLVNALLYSGAVGGLIILIMYLNLSFVIFRQRKTGWFDRITSVKFLRYGCGLALFGYLLKGMVHNDSFVIGGGIGWVLLGVYTICVDLESHPA
jgi:hypothetical protein